MQTGRVATGHEIRLQESASPGITRVFVDAAPSRARVCTVQSEVQFVSPRRCSIVLLAAIVIRTRAQSLSRDMYSYHCASLYCFAPRCMSICII